MDAPKRDVEHISKPSPLPSPYQGEGEFPLLSEERARVRSRQRVKKKLRALTHRLLAGQEGIALATVLLLTTAMLSLGVFGSRSAQTELRIARNDLLSKRALGIAEGGINHAFGLIKGDLTDGLNDELSNEGTGGGLTTLGSLTTVSGGPDYRTGTLGSGTYEVWAEDTYDETTGTNDGTVDTDNQIKVISRGKVSGAERRIEALIRVQLGPECALITDGDLTISGNPTISGTNGCAHSNEDMAITGNPEFAVQPTSYETMSITGNPELNGEPLTASSNQPIMPIPTVNPLNLNGLNLAEEVRALSSGFRLDADCHIYQGGASWSCSTSSPYCSGGTEVADLTSGDGDGCQSFSGDTDGNLTDCKWNGWECSGGGGSTPDAEWKVSGNTATDGAFFVEGWVKISGNPGDSSDPWDATIIAMNSIDISGNPTLDIFTTTGNLRNILLVSGNDLEMSGNPSNSYTGAIYAHQQVKFNGNPALNGFIIAEDGATTWTGDPAPTCNSNKDLLTCGPSSVSGNVTITYNGLDTALSPPTLTLLSWNEVRN